MNKIITLCFFALVIGPACKTSIPRNNPDPFPPSANLSYTAFNTLYHEGADLYSYSHEAGWTLTLDFGNKAVFTGNDGTRYVFKAEHVMTLPEETGQAIIFEEGTNRLTLKLTRQDCNDPTSDFVSPYTAEIRFNEVMYTGCALFLYNKKMNGNWRFSTLNGNKVSLSSAKNNRLFIDADHRILSGVFNCDSVYSGFSPENEHVQLEGFTSVKINCKTSLKDQAFIGIFQQINAYQLRGDSTLILKDANNEFMFTRNHD